jgi:anti-sigma factor RsiW
MKCDEAIPLLHPYSDGELDLVHRLQIETHLTECADCATREENVRSLRAAVSSSSLYYTAPAGLRARIQPAGPTLAPKRRRPWIQIAAIAAGILLLVASSAAIGTFLSKAKPTADEALAEPVLVAHVRSLQLDHLMDVVSTDRHTVKPWFRGKVDFSPPVPDFAPQRYPLSGGRLDYLAERPVAALVYHRALHPINVFIWPAANDEEKAVRTFTRLGFHLRCWQKTGMVFWAISDLNDRELDEFVRLFRDHTAGSQP